MPQEGMLVQIDGSHHPWLEERGPKLVLLLAVDDATGVVAQAVFHTGEDTRGYLVMLEGLVRQWGIPLALYSDRHAAFKYNARQAPVLAESTQFARVMRELGIRQIYALSPQAKGRVERMGSTLQDRLVTELRLAGAATIQEANDVLQQFLPRFNAQFAVAAEQPEKAYRPVSAELSLTETICLKHPRKVGRDNTVKYHWRVLQLLPGMDRPSYAGLQVEVLERADGQLMIGYHGETVDFQESPQPLSSLWGATNPGSLGPELQPIADDPANGHLSHAQRTLLDSLEPPDEEGVSAKRVVTKVGRGAVKPVRHLVAPDAYSDPAGPLGGSAAGQEAGTLPAGHRPQAGHVTRSRQQIRPGGESPNQTTQRQGACQGRGYGRIIDRRGLARMTFSLFT